jgi:hypothetical protein
VARMGTDEQVRWLRRECLWPLFGSGSCCSHPRKGEEIVDAVRRCIRQELDRSEPPGTSQSRSGPTRRSRRHPRRNAPVAGPGRSVSESSLGHYRDRRAGIGSIAIPHPR